jgi:hypothetical protein
LTATRSFTALAAACAALVLAAPASATYGGTNGRVAWHSHGDM